LEDRLGTDDTAARVASSRTARPKWPR
jgi:hypothetical protein